MSLQLLAQLGFYLLLVGPVVAAILAFKATPPVSTVARHYLLLSWLAYGAATAWCLWACFFARESGGIGNGVFLIIAIPLGVIAGILFSVWRAARPPAYV
ncbi:hypothetical protein HPC49_45410 [Pyxidicoccus fallax]|uniref:Uncharacterized protein n=1 Tax=Pyxidicoccus fallax TaxID=394095 RepID=A0A848LXV8_9BACT|nr:hypothetical protein [Pyxidicoccus fallax]NMO22957.1 hypothetical protein [Pyxidicoccus fallax]NPC85420.1 hypothetical protein [Pyxidicoccus fallax]